MNSSDVNSDHLIASILHLARRIRSQSYAADLNHSVAVRLVLVLDALHVQIWACHCQLDEFPGTEHCSRVVFAVFKKELKLEARFAQPETWSFCS